MRRSRTMTKRSRPVHGFRRCAATAGALALVVLAWAALPAQAQVIDRERFAFSFSEESELCGIAVLQDSEVTGTAHVRVGKGKVDSAFFAHVTYQYTDMFTNPANGKFLVIEGHAVFQETKAIPIEGTVFRFIDVEAGQIVVLRDSSGRVVLRDRGAFRSSILFDTLGDDTPGGEELEDRVTIRLAGPHPSFDEEAFCAAVEDLIG
jgi:hypothetical protein